MLGEGAPPEVVYASRWPVRAQGRRPGGCLGALGDAALVEVLVLDVRPSHKTMKPVADRCIPRTDVQSLYQGPAATESRPTAPHALLPRLRTTHGANTCDDGLLIGTNNNDDRDGTACT